ncbi:hypothetical protein F511_40927 [Dorcoceras hygrometricum]|uniref:Splicing factor 3B subunit 1-like n=1 Tax=Dorcoceras hygrometricum TaxID=472368 RepID=A0A2Z7CS63_9LAMI|nr:hypothetical protein F511_40927 [Dorcoceras hygrometricum]
MAYSLISNTNQVYFSSFLGMDNEGMVAMFEAIISSGLNGFLGCLSAIYDADLVEFFQNASIGNGQLSTSCKKRETKIEFRLLNDILAKSVTVKVGSFDAVTHERFLMMSAINGGVQINWGRLLFNIFKDMVTPGSRQAKGYSVQICTLLKNVPDLELGDSKEFPPLKILTAKTVSRYIAINNKIAVEDVEDEPRVKKTPMKKAVSRKRPATAVVEPAVKRKRTLVGKAADVAKDSVLVTVAQEAVPLQIVAPIFDVPPAPKRKSPKNTSAETAKLLELEITGVDEIEKIVEQQDNELTADDVDTIIEKILQTPLRWKTMQETEKNQGTKISDVVQTTDEESMSLDELLATISHGSVLPSTVGEITKIQFGRGITIRGVNEGDWYKASLPKILAADKGKAPLNERDPIKGHPAPTLKSDEDIYAKEEQVLIWAETDSIRVALQRRMYILIKYRELLLRRFLEARRSNFIFGQSFSAIDLKVLDMLSSLHMFVLEELKTQMWEHGLQWQLTCCSRLFEVNGSWVIEECGDYWKPIPRKIVCSEILPQLSYVDTLPPVSDFHKLFRKRWADVCIDDVPFSLTGVLHPVRTVNFCRDIVVQSSVVDIFEKLPTGFCSIFKQDRDTNYFVSYLEPYVTQSVLQNSYSGSNELTVYYSPSPRSKEFISSEHPDLCTSDSVDHTAQEPLVQGDPDLIADTVEPLVQVAPDSIPTDTAFDQDGGKRSSSHLQPPPDDKDRGSGGSRGDRSGSSRKRHFSSGGGPQRRSAEYWFGGK